MTPSTHNKNEFLFTSPRLGFRLIRESDFDNLLKLDSDPEIRAYFPMGMLNAEQVKDKIKQNIELYKAKKFCIFIAIDLATGKFAGRCGFDEVDTKDIEVGYVFFKEYWGKGLATEALARLLQWAEINIKSNRIIAFTPVNHIASQRVMEKCDMIYYKNEVMYGMDCKFYKKELHRETLGN